MRPEELHPADRRREKRRRDAAYAGFLYLGAVLATAFALNWIPVTTPGYWPVAVFLSFPALVLAVPAGLLALLYTVVVRSERSLWVMAALVAAAGPALWSVPRLPDAAHAVVGVFFAALAILFLALPLAWFFSLRREWSRAFPGEPEDESRRPW